MAILKRRDGSIIADDPNKSFKQLVEKNKANLSGTNLSGTNLSGANLSGANLSGTNLSEANLSWADLSEANLSWADLSEANLSGVNLSWANLSEAKIEFYNLPSIRLISSISLGSLSSSLSHELMRWDCSMHPNPKKFDIWAKGGNCPYQNEERFFYFETRKKDWIIGDYTPRMNWVELCKAICKETGWKIRGVDL